MTRLKEAIEQVQKLYKIGYRFENTLKSSYDSLTNQCLLYKMVQMFGGGGIVPSMMVDPEAEVDMEEV